LPYTPPSGSSANFVFTGSHTDPLGNAVDFAFGSAGSLAATESGSDTAAISISVPVDVSLAATEAGSDTAAGDVTVSAVTLGTVTVSLDASESGEDTGALDGTVGAVTATADATEASSDAAALDVAVAISATLEAAESGADTALITGTVDAVAEPPTTNVPSFSGGGPFRPVHHPVSVHVQHAHVEGQRLVARTGLRPGYAAGGIKVPATVSGLWPPRRVLTGMLPGRAVAEQRLAEDEMMILFFEAA
jgi:hypothetical protein